MDLPIATHRRVLAGIGAVTAATLVLVARSQIYDTNFYLLWEAAAILEGDHPYRDFFEWGAPLAAYLSAGMQLLVGYRLIGEFATQWLFITAGVVISFHLGLRLSRSVPVSLVMFAVTLPIVAYAPTYHYSKLFFFPATIWLAWRYMDRPSASRAAILGCTTAAAFLFRHDYGVYIGSAGVMALGLARAAAPESRRLRSIATDTAGYALGVAVVVMPWAAVVQLHEGLVDYVRLRAALYEEPRTTFIYTALVTENPVAPILSWLRAPASPEAAANGVLWLKQMGLLVPLLLLGLAALEWRSSLRRGNPTSPDVWRMVVAGVFLVVVASFLFREPPYVVVSAPVTAALASRFLAGRGVVGRTIAGTLVVLTAVAAIVWTRESPLFRPMELPRSVASAFGQLLASPPVPAESSGAPSPWLQYLRDCSVPGDRLLVSGSTPFQVGYYTRRPPAGGHIFWRQRWRRDPKRQEESLALLRQQSVPFAYSTNDPILKELEFYPKIRAYFVEHYVELKGGTLLVDRRRQATGTFMPLGLPCFR
jgi:hypothetical protein